MVGISMQVTPAVSLNALLQVVNDASAAWVLVVPEHQLGNFAGR